MLVIYIFFCKEVLRPLRSFLNGPFRKRIKWMEDPKCKYLKQLLAGLLKSTAINFAMWKLVNKVRLYLLQVQGKLKKKEKEKKRFWLAHGW